MAIKYLSSKRIQGLSSDTKPTNVQDDTEFTETDTGNVYKISSGTWSLLNSATGGNTNLDALTDVDLTTDTPDNGDVLTYTTTGTKWVPAPVGASSFERTAFTYLVYHDGSNYVARNGRTGTIQFTQATDGFATLNSAIDATSTLGGGVVAFDGTILGRSMLVPKNNVWVMGRGASSVLKQDNTQNLAAVIRSNAFATLSALTTGSGGNGGVESFYLTNCVIDGNKANNTSTATDGIQFYGFDFHFEDINIRNCKGRGMYTEWDDDPLAPNIRTSMEAFYSNIRIHDNDAEGWLNRGPHDWVGRNIIIYDNGSHGYIQEYSAGNYDGGGFVDTLHAYANDGLYGIWLKGGTLHGNRITGESCANAASGVNGIGIYVNGGGLDCNDAWAFGQDKGILFGSGSASQVSGIRAENNKVMGVEITMNDVKIEGVYRNNNNAGNTAGVGIKIGAAGTAVSVVHIAGYIANHKTTNIEWANAGNNGVIITPMICYTTATYPTVLTGSPNLSTCSVSIENHADSTPKDYRFSVVTYDQIQKALFHRIDGQVVTGANTISGIGLLAGVPISGAAANTFAWDNWEGRYTICNTSTTSGTKCGLNWTTGSLSLVDRRQNPRMKVRVKVPTSANTRLYVGLSSATSIPATDTALATTDQGVLMGWDSTDTQISYWHNEGGGATATTATIGPASSVNANWHQFEIQFDEVTARCVLTLTTGGVSYTTTLSTKLPTTDTQLIPYVVVSNTTAATRSLYFGQVLLEKDFIP